MCLPVLGCSVIVLCVLPQQSNNVLHVIVRSISDSKSSMTNICYPAYSDTHTGPRESCEIAAKVVQASAEYLEAPVLGSQPEASKGTLLIMVGSETNPQDSRAWPVLSQLSQDPKHMGPVGTAAATKLALNQLIASLTVRRQCTVWSCHSSSTELIGCNNSYSVEPDNLSMTTQRISRGRVWGVEER